MEGKPAQQIACVSINHCPTSIQIEKQQSKEQKRNSPDSSPEQREPLGGKWWFGGGREPNKVPSSSKKETKDDDLPLRTMNYFPLFLSFNSCIALLNGGTPPLCSSIFFMSS